jgi:hypothetical protein
MSLILGTLGNLCVLLDNYMEYTTIMEYDGTDNIEYDKYPIIFFVIIV